MTVEQAVALCGEPVEISEKRGMVWRSPHFLGWFELRADADDTSVIVSLCVDSNIGPGVSLFRKRLITRISGG